MAQAVRKIVSIDKTKCNGCGLCVTACHEGAIQMVDGKAELVSDIYCDGLGDCLSPCPTGAISIVQRSADAYDEEAVQERAAAMNRPSGSGCPGSAARSLKTPGAAPANEPLPCGCPGSLSKTLKGESGGAASSAPAVSAVSDLMNWPVQLRLIPPGAPYLRGADFLLAADCAPVAVPNFHNRYMKNKPVIIACPKLEDNEPQIAKLAEMIRTAQPASITVVRMEVPCCGGLVRVAEQAVAMAGTNTPVHSITVGIDGLEK